MPEKERKDFGREARFAYTDVPQYINTHNVFYENVIGLSEYLKCIAYIEPHGDKMQICEEGFIQMTLCDVSLPSEPS